LLEDPAFDALVAEALPGDHFLPVIFLPPCVIESFLIGFIEFQKREGGGI
jgi:hypothetical protein